MAALVALLGARAGLRVSFERVFRISVAVQLAFGASGIMMMLAILAHGSGPRSQFVPLLAVLIHLYHLGAGALATLQRKPYPWRVFRWTFPVAALAFYAPSLFQLVRHPSMLVNPYTLLLQTATFLPGVLQVALLWWPAAASRTPAAANRTPESAGLSEPAE